MNERLKYTVTRPGRKICLAIFVQAMADNRHKYSPYLVDHMLDCGAGLLRLFSGRFLSNIDEPAHIKSLYLMTSSTSGPDFEPIAGHISTDSAT